MPGFFETMSIPLVRGRTFTEHDNLGSSAPVVIVNQRFVRKYFSDEDPIGRYVTPRLEYSGEPFVARQIIGIVGNTVGSDPWDDPYQDRLFLPYAQYPTHPRPRVVMKVSGDPSRYMSAIQLVAKRIDPEALVFDYGTFSDHVREFSVQPRFEAVLVSTFGGIALLLSAIGLYAVLAYIVAERTRELGLRMAFGASRSQILGLVVRRAMLLGFMGIVAGGIGSIFAGRLVSGLLFRVRPLDPSTYVLVALALLIVSAVSGLGPALKASYVNPMQSLRDQ